MNKIVAHFKDGRVLKGSSMDVAPNRPMCHITPVGGTAERVVMDQLKALFFVRTLEGDPERTDATAPDPEDPRLRGSTLVRLVLTDGEEIVGMTNSFPPVRPFYFVLPVDPESNNIRILVNAEAVRSIDQVPVG
jgi:Family of unknown function (DUF6982)